MDTEQVRQAGFKLTKPRRLVFELLNQHSRPLSAQEISEQIKEPIDLVTIYRILKKFEESELIHSEEQNNTKYYYLSERPHHHVTCSSCGLVECVPCHHQIKIKNFSNIKHQLVLTGVCSNCT